MNSYQSNPMPGYSYPCYNQPTVQPYAYPPTQPMVQPGVQPIVMQPAYIPVQQPIPNPLCPRCKGTGLTFGSNHRCSCIGGESELHTAEKIGIGAAIGGAILGALTGAGDHGGHGGHGGHGH